MDGLPKDGERGGWRQTTKNVVIWAVLIAMIMVIARPYHWWALGILLGVMLLVVLLIGFVVGRRLRAFLPDINDANSALHRGELDAAEKIFWRWSEDSARRAAALSRHCLAWTFMRKCDLQRAIELQTANIDSYERELMRLSMLPTSLADLSIFHALKGDIDAADKHLAALDKRTELKHSTSFPPMNTFTRAVVACRRGDAAGAARLLDDKWSESEAAATGDLLRPMRVVRAFAIASVDMRDAGKAASILGDMRPSWRGEFDFLGVEWPEMAAFLATHNLATKELAA